MDAFGSLQKRIRPSLMDFEPYDPSYTPVDINLSANENTHSLPHELKAAVDTALLSTTLNRYPDPMAAELREELASWHRLTPDMFIAGNGGDELLYNLIFAFGGPGRVLMHCSPDFAVYTNFAKLTDTPVVDVPRDPATHCIDAASLLAVARRENPALIILTSPNNPTGDLLSHALLRRLLDETSSMILVDEAYIEFAPEGSSVSGWIYDNPRLMVLRTFSKAFAMAGLRVGYLMANPEIIAVMSAVRQTYSLDVLAQRAACVALRYRDAMEGIIADIVFERERLTQSLSGISGVRVWPSYGNFLCVQLPDSHMSWERLRDEYSILVRDAGAQAGLTGCLRITVGTRDENNALIAALSQIRREC